jgi:hypothetical protein
MHPTRRVPQPGRVRARRVPLGDPGLHGLHPPRDVARPQRRQQCDRDCVYADAGVGAVMQR